MGNFILLKININVDGVVSSVNHVREYSSIINEIEDIGEKLLNHLERLNFFLVHIFFMLISMVIKNHILVYRKKIIEIFSLITKLHSLTIIRHYLDEKICGSNIEKLRDYLINLFVRAIDKDNLLFLLLKILAPVSFIARSMFYYFLA